MKDEGTGLRVVAGVGALIAVVVGAYGALVALLFSPQKPDPAIPDGDPCCTHPDTWAEVLSGLPWFFAWVFADAFAFSLAAALVLYMAIGYWPRLRYLLVFPAGVLMLTGVGTAVALT